MKLSLVSSLILLLSASLFVNASPLYRRNEDECSVIGDTSMINITAYKENFIQLDLAILTGILFFNIKRGAI